MNLEESLSCRERVESFRAFLRINSQHGLKTFQMWLTLNGYVKEYNRYRLLYDSQLDNFIRWNLKCAKALVEKFFDEALGDISIISRSRLHAINDAYRQCRKFPTMAMVEKLKDQLLAICGSTRQSVEKYFDKYCKSGEAERVAKHPALHQIQELHNNTEYASPSSDITSSDNYSSIAESTQIDRKDKKKYKRRQKVN